MEPNQDFALVKKINAIHFRLALFDDVEQQEIHLSKHLLASLDEIGRLLGCLSKSFVADFHEESVQSVLASIESMKHAPTPTQVRLFIKEDLPLFMDKLTGFARYCYMRTLDGFIGKMVHVIVDRPLGHHHKGITYQLNYGYIRDLITLDGEEQDAYIVGENVPLEEFDGEVIAIIRREDDVEDKLVVAKKGTKLPKEEIGKLVHFQERYFQSKVILK